MEKNEYRLQILAKMEEYEKKGLFDQDLEDDPPTIPLHPHEVDFERRKISSKIKSFIADKVSFLYFKKCIRKGQIVIDSYEGIENLKSIKGGAIITQNHFNPFDSIPLHLACKKYQRKHGLYKIIREGNYHFPGLFGYFMKHCYSLPLSSNLKVMKECMTATNNLLKKGKFILVYAEQSLWWNYRKPKPLKEGAFKFAVKARVPILPTFITMRDTDKLDGEGFPIQAYTLHFLSPIYFKEELSDKENIEYMKKENERLWKELYEKVYGIPLTYLTEN